MVNSDYKKLEEKTRELFALLNPPELVQEVHEKDEPCFFWDNFFINWEDLIAEHAMLLDFRISVSDKTRIYDKFVKLFKI